MVLFNHATKEMTAKIVYYGPGLCGKTTNLMVIFDKLDEGNRGKMLSLATKTDRTLFFDLLPVDIGKVGPFNLKIQLYTVPGQVFYNETRKLVLKGADAIVFVADSQPSMIDSNLESFQNLRENMEENQIDFDQTPILIQYNKRDLPDVLPIPELQEKLDFEVFPWTAASALQGDGVMETFKKISKITAKHLVTKVKGKESSLKTLGRLTEEEAAAAIKEAKKAGADDESVAAAEEAAAPEAPFEEPEEIPDAGVDVASPFGDEAPPFAVEETPVETDYDAAQEVSLDELLVDRERPKTLTGVAIPVLDDDEDVEDLDTAEEVDIEAFVEPAASPEPAGVESGELKALKVEVEELRKDHEKLKETVQKLLAKLKKK